MIVDIPEFPGYRVDDMANVWSCRVPKSGALGSKWKKLKPIIDDADRYFYVNLRKVGKTFKKYLHQIVLESFVGPAPDGMECCHNNGDKLDCRLENLRYDTRSANQMDRVQHGTSNRGSKHSRSKLTESDIPIILEIRREISNATLADIGILFGVSTITISGVVTGANWSWLTGIKRSGKTRKKKTG